MSSSIFNSRKRVAIALCVLVVFGALEFVTRTRLFKASKDLRRFTSYPARARALHDAPSPRVAFVGNSLTDRGVDPKLFGELMHVSADAFVADASHLTTWTWMIEKLFWKPSLAPDLIVLDFYENGLEDGKRIELGRLAQFFSDRDDWGQLFSRDVTTLGERLDFVLSSVWATFAVRDRIEERVLDLIPGYKNYLEQSFAATSKQKRVLPTRPRGLTTLRLFVARAQERRTRILFVAFPTVGSDPTAAEPYEVSPETLKIIADAGMLYVDMRRTPGLEPRHYSDDIHLTPEGQAIFTRALAARLAGVWP
jgi:hypothetical protein